MRKMVFVVASFFDLIKYILASFIFNKIKLSDTWLISERGTDARDNGYWFYKFLKEEHPEIKAKYVIAEKSSDYHKISKEDVVAYRSMRHYRYLFTSKYLVSAEIMGFTPNERLYYRLNKKGLLRLRGKKVFLQHGITKDYFEYMRKENTKLDLFICGAKREYDYMRDKYMYDERNLALTGFARFDRLYDNDEKMILIIPTWRKWLRYSSTLRGTEFFTEYEKLLNDKDIIEQAKKNKYKIVFYPHPDMQKFLDDFYLEDGETCRIASSQTDDIQDLFRKASILITDYSSVAFDIAYMGKKTIYYQFDKAKYREQQYGQGYYDYDKDGFGPVAEGYSDVKREVLDFMKQPSSFNVYDQRVNSFFGKRDDGNCRRIYNAIIEMGDK